MDTQPQKMTTESSDIILILEDDKTITKGFLQFQEDFNLDLEFLICENYIQLNSKFDDSLIKNRIKCLIMDLSNNQEEDTNKTFESTKYIKQEFDKNRIPIFIHSGYLDSITEFDNLGTIFKIPKSKDSVSTICQSIKLMYDSGFLNIFAIGGSLENKIMAEIHKAFIGQFKSREIEDILKSITIANPENNKERIQEVFERIALRAVYQSTICNKTIEKSVKVNSIEHYYRRKDSHIFWTGDIFKNKESDELYFIATPRCNISNNNFEDILMYKISKITPEQTVNFTKGKSTDQFEKKGGSQLRSCITDNVANSNIGERYRFLPKTPQFEGGFVDCMKCITIKEEILNDKYIYAISLIDDLTNDVIRKAASYLLRGGISDTDYTEAIYYFTEKDNLPLS